VTFPQKRFLDLKTGGKLPSPSGVALRLIELTRKEDVSIEEIARAMQADPALSGRLIKFANSAINGPRRPVVSVFDAIQRIGIGAVRQLVLGFSVLGSNRTGSCGGFDYPRFWSRSLATAIAAGALCLRVRVVAAEEAFTCGLLADVGSLALATLYPAEYARLLEAQRDAPRSAREQAERGAFDVDHRELGAALLEDWGLPRMFVNAVQFQDDPASSKAPHGSRDHGLMQLLALAAGIGEYCVATDAARKTDATALVLDAAKLGLDAETLAMLADQVVADWRDWGRILDVQTQAVDAFAGHAARAAIEGEVDRTRPSAGQAPLDILIADDDDGVLMVLEAVLQEQGHRVVSAGNGRDALALAVKHSPQLVISDWQMPEMDGIELCRTLRGTEQGNRIYFILLTGNSRDDQLIEGFEAGVDDYVTKPFSPRVLTARLRAAARVVSMQQELERDSANLRKFATELAVANRRLQQAALTDSLTGLPNRRHLIERLEQEWAAHQRRQQPLVAMMIDIDGFKAVNDGYGHEVGDQLLRQLSALLRESARTEDVVGRLGGEEFVVICPGANLAVGLRLAERLRQCAAGHAFQAGSLSLRATVSIGVAERAPGMAHPDDMLRAADAALYRAKHNGRNCVQAARFPLETAGRVAN
jgi:two-component system, cell cycle response regulator